MNTIDNLLAIHRTNERDENTGKRQPTFYVSDGKWVEQIGDMDKFMESLNPQTQLRFTSVHAQDPTINFLANKGHKIVYANWHKTGIEKNLPPDKIVQQFANLPVGFFREFTPRPELADLRKRVSQRLAILEYRKAVILKLRGAGILAGETNEDDLSDEIKMLLKEAEKIDIKVPVKTKNISIDTVISNLAKSIRECRLFNAAAHLSSGWNTAAAVVAYSGGIDRFDTVASFWHYCGDHVVDGRAPKRAKGQPISWNPKLRTILWQMSDSIIKNSDNPWRKFYDVALAQEISKNTGVHPHDKTNAAGNTVCGHCGARAKRKMRKEILKRFFLACKGEEYSSGHSGHENRAPIAAA